MDIAPKAEADDLETAEIVVDFDGPDQALLLERNGDLLKALEHIAVRWLRLDPQFYNRVRFDCGDFRASRVAELRLSARKWPPSAFGRRANPFASTPWPRATGASFTWC